MLLEVRVGNRGRLSLCEALRELSETKLYFELGYPSLTAYAQAVVHLGRSEACEHVRVAMVSTAPSRKLLRQVRPRPRPCRWHSRSISPVR